MRRLVHLTIILILLTITFGTASCNNSQLTSRAPGLPAYEKQSASDTDNINSQPQNITSQDDANRIDVDKTTGKELESESYPLTDQIVKADIIVLGTITEKRYDVVTVVSENTTGKSAYTLFTLSVEKVLKGDSSIEEAIIRVPGGFIDDEMYQVVNGVRYFCISDHVLLGLIKQENNIYTLFTTSQYGDEKFFRIYDSVFWIYGSAMTRDPLELVMGRICKILRINGIPNSLNEPCPEPAEPASPPTSN